MPDEYFEIDPEELKALADANEFCPKDCPHKTKVDVEQIVLNFRTIYVCEKYRSVLGIHAANPMAAIMGGDPIVLVCKAPFCRKGLEVTK